MTRVLIVSSYFWPDRTGVAVYTTGLARHLSDQGDDVTVLTGMPHYPAWRREADAPAEHDRVRIVRHRHYVPRRPTAARRALYEAGFLAGGMRKMRSCPEPDVVLGVSPCLASARVALAAGSAAGAPVGIVFQDIVTLAASQAAVRGGRLLAAPLRRAELSIAGRADRVGLTSPGYRSFFEGAGVPGERITELRNWAEREAPDLRRAAARERLGWGQDEFVCLHAGNMGQKQGLDNLIDAAGRVEAERVRVVLAGGGNDRVRLERRVARADARVTFEPVQRPGAYEATLGAADCLLLGQRASVRDMALPSKLTAYFAAGRPVLAAVAPDSAAAAEVRRSGGGMIVAPDDPAALAAGIRRLMALPASERDAMGATGEAYAAAELAPERVLPAWGAFVNGLLERSPRARPETLAA